MAGKTFTKKVLFLAAVAALHCSVFGYFFWFLAASSVSQFTLVAIFTGCLLLILAGLWKIYLMLEKLKETNRQLLQANSELNSLKTISEFLNSSLDLPVILNQSLKIILETLAFEYCQVWIKKHDSPNLFLAASNLPDNLDLPSEISEDQGLAARAFQCAGPIFIENPEEELTGHDREFYHKLGYASLMAYPIFHRYRELGLIMIASKTVSSFDEQTKDLLTTYINTIALAIRNARLYEKVREQVIRDELTGLYNHRYLMQRLDEEIQRAERHGHSLSLLMLDLDDFKKFNDAYGHLAGNKVLSQIGQVLKANTRGIDLAARFGGEEFAVVLADTGPDLAVQVAERIRYTLQQHPYVTERGKKVFSTLSAGIAAYPFHARSAMELLQRADEMLYKAKEQKDHVEVCG